MVSNSPLKRSITYEDEDEEMEIARKKFRECGYTQPAFNAIEGNFAAAPGGSRHIDDKVNVTGGSMQSTEEGRATDEGMPVD
jgi:hypothetical protein